LSRNLDGKNFDRMDLVGESFAGRDLRGAVFTHCNLSESDFTNADLSGARITDCLLQRTRLSGATLNDARLESVDMGGAIAAAARAEGVWLRGAIARAVQWSGSDLSRCCFELCDLTGSVFQGASAQGATFDKVNAERTDFAGADLSYASFNNVSLLMASLVEANLVGAELGDVALVGAELRGARTSKIDVHGVRLSLAGTQIHVALRKLAKPVLGSQSYAVLAGLSGEAFRFCIHTPTGRLLPGGDECENLRQMLELLDIPYRTLSFKVNRFGAKLRIAASTGRKLVLPFGHKVSRDGPPVAAEWGVIEGFDDVDGTVIGTTLFGGETVYGYRELCASLAADESDSLGAFEIGAGPERAGMDRVLVAALERVKAATVQRNRAQFVRGLSAYEFFANETNKVDSRTLRDGARPPSAYDLAFHLGARRSAVLFVEELIDLYGSRFGRELNGALDCYRSVVTALVELTRYLPEVIFSVGDKRRNECFDILAKNKSHIGALLRQAGEDERKGSLMLAMVGNLMTEKGDS